MAVPKKRTGASAQGHRRSNWKATVPETTTCPNCGELVLTHTVCTACGQYKGKVVSRKAEGFVEDAKAEAPKKAAKAKKAPAKKTKKAAEESTVEETKVEEVKAEEKAEEVKEEKSSEE
ncbi:MAG: 50S ribosomal protein L32 [Clostridium sp.]|nr:50S ribosomal protein L32 [Clostridium sp.]